MSSFRCVGLGTLLLALTAATISSAGCNGAHASGVQAPPPTEITACGAVISTPGIYTVSQSLKSDSPSEDCIQIASPGVSPAFASGTHLTGPGGAAVTAAGVHVLATANGVQIVVRNVTIEKFGVGIKVEGSGVSIFSTPTESFVLTGNAAEGVLVTGASNVVLNSIVSQENGASGVELLNSSGVFVEELSTLQDNGAYGLWVHGSFANQIFNADAFSNHLGGIFIGEVNGDQLPASHNNVILAAGAVQNSGAGIGIGLGDNHNVVSSSTGQANTGMDAVDANADCGTNSWVGNTFITTSAGCIH
jgi:hypothetical protein